MAFPGAICPASDSGGAVEARAWAAELHALGENGDYFISLNRYLFLAEKPGAP